MTTKTTRPTEDKHWLASVRADLDSNAMEWARKPDDRGQSKAQAVAAYLDRLLTDLGFPVTTAAPHDCPRCGFQHQRRA